MKRSVVVTMAAMFAFAAVGQVVSPPEREVSEEGKRAFAILVAKQGEALVELQQLRQDNPANAEILHAIGLCFVYRDNPEMARSMLVRAVRETRKPTRSMVYNMAMASMENTRSAMAAVAVMVDNKDLFSVDDQRFVDLLGACIQMAKRDRGQFRSDKMEDAEAIYDRLSIRVDASLQGSSVYQVQQRLWGTEVVPSNIYYERLRRETAKREEVERMDDQVEQIDRQIEDLRDQQRDASRRGGADAAAANSRKERRRELEDQKRDLKKDIKEKWERVFDRPYNIPKEYDIPSE